jgi:hypothetical protein
MPSFQCRKLLTESEVFNQEAATCVEDAKNGAEQKSKGLCHAGLLSRFACGTQRYILLKSQADRIFANDRHSTFELHKERPDEESAGTQACRVALSWIESLPSKQNVAGSSPAGRAYSRY